MKYNKNLRDTLISISLFVLLISAVYFIYGPKIIENFRADWQPNQAPVVIAELSPQMELVTEYPNSYVRQMALEGGVAYIGGSLSEEDLVALLSLDPLTQQINWQVRPSSRIITIDSNRVYIWSGTGEVTAFDKMTGIKVWQEVVDSRFTIIDALTITPFGLLVESRNPSGIRYHLVDFETGEELHSFQTEVEKNDFWLENGLSVFSIAINDDVIAEGENEWRNSVDFDDHANAADIQLIVRDHIIIAYKESDSITQISALNRTNGDILWHFDEHIKSNLVEDGNLLFFVTTDALIGVDINTGQMNRHIVFSPGIQEDHSYNSDVKIALDNGQMLIFFNSSKQLFVLQYAAN
jgi:outer membrane protein assembly factor BamB